MMSSRAWFRAVLCLSTALMMTISWPLWVTGGDFPRVPWIGGMRLLPMWASWVRFVVAIVAMIAAAWPGRCDGFGLFTSLKRKRRTVDPEPSLALQARVGRGPIAPPNPALAIALLMSAWMVLEDQFRLQPWIYQFLLMGFALAVCEPGQAARLCRWFLIAQYFHSGLSKLDYSFTTFTGREFLHQLTRPIGLDTRGWPQELQKLSALSMPCWEIGVAAALAIKARRIGVAMAVILHLGLFLILGPWGMNHSANVLIWNVALLVEVVILFSTTRVANPLVHRGRSVARAVSSTATFIVIGACLLPFGERQEWWDTWPSFGLYADSNETASIVISDKSMLAVSYLAEHRQVYPPGSGLKSIGFILDLSLSRWSFAERRVPIYPSARALNGVAEALASRYGERRSVQVVHQGRADRRTGERVEVQKVGLDAIRRHGDTYWLNAHPAR